MTQWQIETHTHRQSCQNNLIAFHAYLFCPQRAALVTGHVKAVSNFTEIIRACQLVGGSLASLPRPLLQLTLESGKKPNQSVGARCIGGPWITNMCLNFFLCQNVFFCFSVCQKKEEARCWAIIFNRRLSTVIKVTRAKTLLYYLQLFSHS